MTPKAKVKGKGPGQDRVEKHIRDSKQLLRTGLSHPPPNFHYNTRSQNNGSLEYYNNEIGKRKVTETRRIPNIYDYKFNTDPAAGNGNGNGSGNGSGNGNGNGSGNGSGSGSGSGSDDDNGGGGPGGGNDDDGDITTDQDKQIKITLETRFDKSKRNSDGNFIRGHRVNLHNNILPYSQKDEFDDFMKRLINHINNTNSPEMGEHKETIYIVPYGKTLGGKRKSKSNRKSKRKGPKSKRKGPKSTHKGPKYTRKLKNTNK